MLAAAPPRSVAGMTQEVAIQRVRAKFAGAPPAERIERASGVSQVVVDGATLRCVVSGSFQPFLDALLGHEVISFEAIPDE
jgi:hypothetical protein